MTAQYALHLHPHHDGSPLYTEDIAPVLGGQVRLWVRVPATVEIRAMYVRTRPDGRELFTACEVDQHRTGHAIGGYGQSDIWWTVLATVHNPVSRYRFLIQTPDGTSWLQANGLHSFDVTDNDDFRLVVDDSGPQWSANAIVYEIFPDRFARASTEALTVPDWAVPCDWDNDPVRASLPLAPLQVYGGDLDGIAQHLDYIADLGANTIYLRPIFPAQSNHRYNATTFDAVDPLVGGLPALRRLTEAIHDRQMYLVGDITTNHCGDTHEWFRSAITSPEAPERDMFYFASDGSYEAWFGVPTLPKLNWGNALVRERMTAVVRHWLEFYDGWRVDVANMTGRFGAENRTREIAQLIRAAVRSVRPDGALVGEHMYDASADLDAGGWDGTMNYAGFTRPVWTWLADQDAADIDFIGVPGGIPHRNGRQAVTSMRAFAAQMSWSAWRHSWLVLDSFDCARIRSVVGTGERQLVAAGLQACLPGVPMICAGTEFGHRAVSGEAARVPMPWNRPDDGDRQTYDAYRRLFNLRAASKALQEGGLRWWHLGDEVLVLSREHADGSVLVQARRSSGRPVTLPLDVALYSLDGAETLYPTGGLVSLPGDGPAIRMWRIGSPA